MEAKELVGKLICSDVVTTGLNMPSDMAVKVVGYNSDLGQAIIDADLWGWHGLDVHDHVTEKCKTYRYVRLGEITKVL